jgi:bifunctional DNA-binding transcriptional regulator/antitoxin component of YhaV-PrlF toxin-antitoxin module
MDYNFLEMTYTATLTGKQQLTIPAELFRKLNWEIGQKVLLREENGLLSITSALDQIDRLAGSVTVAKKFKSMPIDQMIEYATAENHKQE